MRDLLIDLFSRLRAAPDRPTAAEALLEAALLRVEAAAPAVRADEELESLEVLGAVIHLRSERGYEAVFALARASGGEALEPSASAWQHLRALRRPVCGDVAIGALTVSGMPVGGRGGGAPVSRRTVQRLTRRRVTHFCAVPLALPSGRLLGMLVVEVACPDAAGQPFGLWTPVEADLEALCALGALFLDQLPAPADGGEGDPGPLPALSPAMVAPLRLLRRFAPSPLPLLLLGETGVGKTTLARWVHAQSPRREGPFETADLAGLNADQAAVRLFGAGKGAWTGGDRERVGALKLADGGTLLIDEVADLHPDVQVQLLRVLDDGCFKPLGQERELQVDVRIVACTNVDLREAVRTKRFRQDLYERLSALEVEVPPLRDRREEIAAWSLRFLEAPGVEGPASTLAPELLAALAALPWEGNLRALRKQVGRLRLLSDGGVVGVEALDLLGLGPSAPPRALSAGLREAAEAWLDGARAADPGVFDGCKGAFPGMVVAVALERTGDPKEAARLLGLGHRERGGNHLVTFRTYRDHLARVLEVVGEPLPEVLRDL